MAKKQIIEDDDFEIQDDWNVNDDDSTFDEDNFDEQILKGTVLIDELADSDIWDDEDEW